VRVRWLRAALDNLNEIAAYIADDNPPAAARTVTKIVEAVNLLTQHPALGRAGRVPGTRELIVADTPFIVPYRVRAGFVEVLRVLHAARKWPTSL
jgi:toxin ParE1/3/4